MISFVHGVGARSLMLYRGRDFFGRLCQARKSGVSWGNPLHSGKRYLSTQFAEHISRIEMTTPEPSGRARNTGKKFYAVAGGSDGFYGVTTNWNDCLRVVKGVNRAKYRAFPTYSEAERFVRDNDIGGRHGFCFINDAGNVMVEAKGKRSMDVPMERSMDSTGRRGAEGYEAPVSNRKERKRTRLDGACTNNGKGSASAGYGVFFGPHDSRNKALPLAGEVQTNNRAELMGVLTALKILAEEGSNGDSRKAEIRTDSNYVKKGLTEWIHNWKRNGWKTRGTQSDVKNRDLWEQLDAVKAECETHRALRIEWVKGHSKDQGNIAADHLAVEGAEARYPTNY